MVVQMSKITMQKSDGTVPLWHQPSTSRKPITNSFLSAGSAGMPEDDLGSLGDIFRAASLDNAASSKRAPHWPRIQNARRKIDGRVGDGRNSGVTRCNCLWPKSPQAEEKQGPNIHGDKMTRHWPHTDGRVKSMETVHSEDTSEIVKGDFSRRERKMAEEFILDDNELCLFNFYDIPVDINKRHRLRKTAKVKTVSIIDTLSEMASGMTTDKEDERTSSSAFSEPPVSFPVSDQLESPFRTRQERTRHARMKTSCPSSSARGNFLPLKDSKTHFRAQPRANTSTHLSFVDHAFSKDKHVVDGSISGESFLTKELLNSASSSKHSVTVPNWRMERTQSEEVDTGLVTCNSLKRTLRYLRKAVSSTVVEEDQKVGDTTYRHRAHRRRREDKEYGRDCFSDSEIRRSEEPNHGSHSVLTSSRPIGGHPSISQLVDDVSVFQLWPKIRTSNSMTTVVPIQTCSEGDSILHEKVCKTTTGTLSNRQRAKVPDWIRAIFSSAKQGDVESLEYNLKDMDASLIRNLSDRHGNNLWHICASHNRVRCLEWLRTHDLHHALTDENKNGLNPVVMAIKHGSSEAVQWLVQNTHAKSQVVPSDDNRSLLHHAAKYGQDRIVQWLTEYMKTHNVDINDRDAEGNTALHLAAKYGNIDCVKTLILHGGDLTAKNELGVKPLDLAMSNGHNSCADYLIASESCLTLSAEHLLLEADVHHLHTENTELKTHFKELLLLTRRLLRYQQELLEAFSKVQNDVTPSHKPEEDGPSVKVTVLGAEESRCSMRRDSRFPITWLEEYNRLLAAVLTEEQGRLHSIEERWKRLRRKQNKSRDNKKSPLDVVRFHFSQVLAKASDRHFEMLTSPETSDDSFHSGEELEVPLSFSSSALTDHTSIKSTPDVIHTSCLPYSPNYSCSLLKHPDSTLSRLNSGRMFESDAPSCSIKNVKQISTRPKDLTDIPPPLLRNKNSLENSALSSNLKPAVSNFPSCGKHVSLRGFFQRNPDLRQKGQTCAVLEVLEPSSSENEDWSRHRKKTRDSKSSCKQEILESGNSSSSSNDFGPSCQGTSPQSLTGYQSQHVAGKEKQNDSKGDQGNTSSTGTVKGRIAQPVITELPLNAKRNWKSKCHSIATATGGNSGTQVKGRSGKIDGCIESFPNSSCDEHFLAEPDILKGTQGKRNTYCRKANSSTSDGTLNKKLAKNCGGVLPSKANICPSTTIATNTEQGNVKKIQQGAVEIPSSSGHSNVERQSFSSNSGPKKKGFLLKFALRGRWPSKQKSRISKKIDEISPEGFRETYSRSLLNKGNGYISDISHSSSQEKISSPTPDCTVMRHVQSQSTALLEDGNISFAENSVTAQKREKNEEGLEEKLSNAVLSQEVTVASFPKVLHEPLATPVVLLPPRREPPPSPPDLTDHCILPEADGVALTSSPIKCSPDAQSTDGNHIPSGPSTSGQHGTCSAFVTHSSTLRSWTSSDVKPDDIFHPASYSSRLDSPSTSVDAFKESEFHLHKPSSASTEMLIGLDCSTAGRQSPDPSEVSKTESALSPPSDVSKTESTKHLNHLGRIEEKCASAIGQNGSGHIMKLRLPFQEKIAMSVDIVSDLCSGQETGDTTQATDCKIDGSNEEAEAEQAETRECKSERTSKGTEAGAKPWYDVSDEEDLLTLHRYRLVTSGMRSSSEDEAEGITS